MYRNLSSVLSLLEAESYLLRIAAMKVMMNIIKLVLSVEIEEGDMEDEGDEEIIEKRKLVYAKTKNVLFEILIKRFYEKSSYCRS